MPGPSLPGLILAAAKDIERVPGALAAELVMSTLLGSAYARLAPDRAAGLAELVEAVRAEADGAVAALLGEPAPVRFTGAYAYGDRYGDESGYLATFAHDGDGGEEHAVVFHVDHGRGLLDDILVIAPASAVLDELTAGTDEMSWSAPIAPAALRQAAAAYLEATDAADELPAAESLRDNRWLAGQRLATLPLPAPADPAGPDSGREELLAEFLAAPEARLAGLTRAGGAQAEAIGYALGLCLDFATERGDPVRWSPRSVEAFLLDWIHERALLDTRDVAALPTVLAAWVSWSGRRVGLPEAAVSATLDRIDALQAEFARLGTSGERQSAAVRATAQLVAEGVDLADPAAVEEWLAAYNARQ